MKLTLYYFKICPFVESTRILLLEKNIDCELVHVNIRNNPDWYTEVCLTGKVPSLKVEQETEATFIFESAIINDFLDEISGSSIHPESAVERA